MKPSEVTLTNPDTLLPIKQLSLIKALPAVWPSPKKRQINPATPIIQGICSQDHNIDPALYSPSEMAEKMRQTLAKTSVANLVSDSPINLSINSISPIIHLVTNSPIKDLATAQAQIAYLRKINASTNSQLLLQHLHVKKLVRHTKAAAEKKKSVKAKLLWM